MIDAKPQKRHRATAKEWAEIRANFSEDRCWVCTEPWTELHHIMSRGAGRGDDVTVNLAPVCGKCHRRIEARDPLARSLIRQALMPSNIGYLRWKLSENAEGWLSRNYPLGSYNARDKEQDLDLGLDLGVDLQSSTSVRELNVALRTNQ